MAVPWSVGTEGTSSVPPTMRNKTKEEQSKQWKIYWTCCGEETHRKPSIRSTDECDPRPTHVEGRKPDSINRGPSDRVTMGYAENRAYMEKNESKRHSAVTADCRE